MASVPSKDTVNITNNPTNQTASGGLVGVIDFLKDLFGAGDGRSGTREHFLQHYAMQEGMIMAWGKTANIPNGWFACDGTKKFQDGSTIPNLQNRFIVAAGNIAALHKSSAVVQSNGTNSITTSTVGNHTHAVVVNSAGNHSHGGETSEINDHTHGINGGGRRHWDLDFGGNADVYTYTTTKLAGKHKHTYSTNSAGSHSHTATAVNSGSHSHTVSTIPPYYSLIYIIFLPHLAT